MLNQSPSTTHTDLLAVGIDTWRAVDRSGRALGHVRREETPHGERFVALRFHAASRAFRTIGAFWAAADAVDSLRFNR